MLKEYMDFQFASLLLAINEDRAATQKNTIELAEMRGAQRVAKDNTSRMMATLAIVATIINGILTAGGFHFH